LAYQVQLRELQTLNRCHLVLLPSSSRSNPLEMYAVLQ
jgi:hypothetical protein